MLLPTLDFSPAQQAATPRLHFGEARVAPAGSVGTIELCLGAGDRPFVVRPAAEQARSVDADRLIDRMYSRRGYDTEFVAMRETRRSMTFVVSDEGTTLGTLTLALDSSGGLLADAMYGDELDAARDEGRTLCEYSKLAVDLADGSKRVLAALFHTAHIYARVVGGATDAFIEVNPRHAPFYRRMLGFVPAGPERSCPRVNAPAILLRLDLDHVDREIARCGGSGADVRAASRSLYPYFFSKPEETSIARRLVSLNNEGGIRAAGQASAALRPALAMN